MTGGAKDGRRFFLRLGPRCLRFFVEALSPRPELLGESIVRGSNKAVVQWLLLMQECSWIKGCVAYGT